MKILLRWIIIFFLVVWLLLISILGASYGLLSTTGGSRWLLEQADSRIEQLEFSWSHIDGSLMRGLEFQDLNVLAQGNRVQAESFSIQWNLFDVLQAEVALSNLSIRNMKVILAEPGDSAESQIWPSISLPIALELNRARIETLEIIQSEESQTVDLLMFSGGLGSDGLTIRHFLLEQGSQGIELSGQLELSPPYDLALDVQWHTSVSQESENFAIKGKARLVGNFAEISLDHRFLTPIALETAGTLETGFDAGRIGFNLDSFVANLENSWSFENFAIPGRDLHLTSSGELNIQGGIAASKIDGSFGLAIPGMEQFPQQQIDLTAEVQENRASLEGLQIDTGFGRIAGNGSVNWGEALSWSLALTLSDMDPGYFITEVPGSIRAVLSSSGQISADTLETELQIDQMSGEIRGFPLTGSGNLAYRENTLIANDLVIRAGDNQLGLNAAWGSNLDLSWDLLASDLSQLYPGLDGVLSMNGTAVGQPGRPEIRAQILAEPFRYEDISAERLQATISSSGSNAGQTLDLSITNLGRGEQQLNLQLNMLGSLNQHEYALQVSSATSSEDVSVRIAGTAVFEEQSWGSDLNELAVNPGFGDPWILETTAPLPRLAIARNQAIISPFCLQSGAASICTTEASFDANRLNLVANLNQVQLEMLNGFLPRDVRISGGLSGNMGLSGPLGELEGNVELEAPEIVLTITQLQKTEFHRLSANQLSGTYENAQMNLRLRSELSGNGLINGEAQIDMRSDGKPVDARLEARFSELTWLDPFLPQLSDLDGDTNIDIQISGTLENPLIGGDVYISNLTAFVPDAGILLERGQIDLVNRSTGNWDLSAAITSGEGDLDINGGLTLNSLTDWNIEMAIRGDQFNAYALDSTQVYVSPDLELRLSPLSIDVTGDVLLPRADFVIKSLPASTVNVSDDEIVIGGETGLDSRERQGPELTADINLLLGDQVMFQGFNIQGRLAGQLRLREAEGMPQRVEGSIEIVDGTYSAYGQELTIDPGRLSFNGPAENPSLNVRAYRTVGGNLVGVHLGGTVETLSSNLYSAPALPQTEILSLLITGKSLSNTTSSEGNQLVSALTSLGIAQSALITQSLQNTLSLDVLEISASEDIEESSVTIGKYLSPRLFISYAQDILTPESSVSLDYILSDRIKINAKSGATQSMDIFYRFERCPDCSP